MPSSLIKSFAEESDKSESEVEKLWNKAKEIAKEQGKGDNYSYIVGILKKMLKINEGNYMKTFKEIALRESKNSDALARSIDKAMIKIDDSMDVKDFAKAVAKILQEQYGSHNYDKFLTALKDDL
jgi:3-methyladenine DNA glycosylase Tag